MRSRMRILAAVLCVALTGCGRVSEEAVKPLMGLDWFSAYDDVKRVLTCTLLEEREVTGQKVPLRMLDYTGVELFDVSCDLTLCFTDSGLIGFNYHDVERNQNYREWYGTLEKTYGLPTEEGSGMASWYDNPVGKDTAVYLFNLEEGVQVSIYATADSPDQSYGKTEDAYIPTPELRTPVIAVIDSPTPQKPPTDANGETLEAPQETRSPRAGRDTPDYDVPAIETAGKPAGTASAEATDPSAPSETVPGATAPAATESTAAATEPPEIPTENPAKSFLQRGLQFYSSPETGRRVMQRYTQLYEYRTEEAGQPWELIMEYENVPYLGKNCGNALCFTSLGLVGINYLDSNKNDYQYWVEQLTALYGNPNETRSGYSAWNNSPVGEGTIIYVFAMEDGVQISFFADDTGSELV